MANEALTKKFWKVFKMQQGITRDSYQAWSFGDTPEMADQLAELVVRGMKTATTSAYELYEADEPLPQPGAYNIILDGRGEPVAVTKTVVTEIVPFQSVSWEHAWHEGEGNRSLAYWRKVHEAFFEKEYIEAGLKFNMDIPCVCEVFEVVFKR